jgi:hypothetical protein
MSKFRTSLPCAYAHGYKDTGATRLLAKHKVLQMIFFIDMDALKLELIFSLAWLCKPCLFNGTGCKPAQAKKLTTKN